MGIAEGLELRGSIVRKPKEYGTDAVIENLITEGKRNILVVDDVLTTGASIENACNEFLKAGYTLKAVFVILDRSDGAVAKMLEDKFKVLVVSIFKEVDFNGN